MKKRPVYDDRVFPAKVFLEAYGGVRGPTAQSSPKTRKPCGRLRLTLGRWKRTWTSRFTSGQERYLLEDVETQALNDAVAKVSNLPPTSRRTEPADKRLIAQ
jgi:hypothetical protein